MAGEVVVKSYSVEEGEARLSLKSRRQLEVKRVVLCDDLVATGGTFAAAAQLVEMAGGIRAGAVAVIELTGLKGRERLKCGVAALQTYEF